MKSAELQNWESSGRYLKMEPFGKQVFYKVLGKEQAKARDTLLLLHGFPESSYSYNKVLTGMFKRFEKIVVFDMPGYGLSDKPLETYSYSLLEQADIALRVWKELGVEGGHLLGHDMGDSVATELLTRQVHNLLPAWFSRGFLSFTFTNGSMVLDLAKLRITQKILLSRYGHWMSKLSTYGIFKQQVTSAHGNSNLSEKDVQLLWENLTAQQGHRKNHLLIKYILDRKKFEKNRWLPALKAVKQPVHICWGEEDAVARVEMAHYLKSHICPHAQLTLMPGVGHFCQLGSPELWVKSVLGFYENQESISS